MVPQLRAIQNASGQQHRAAVPAAAARAGLPRRTPRGPLAVRAFVAEDKNWHKLDVKHVIQAQQFGREAIDVIFREAELMEKVNAGAQLLQGPARRAAPQMPPPHASRHAAAAASSASGAAVHPM
jgi:hypothetical protein